MAEIFFASDWHINHENIIRFCDRPFANVDEMLEALVERHNSVVKPTDHFYNLGDVTMIRGGGPQQERLKQWVSRFNGHKRLILGNHDHFPVQAYVEAGFEKVMAMQVFENMRFTHIPTHPSSMGTMLACVHGHIHDQDSPPPVEVQGMSGTFLRPYINISVERIAYTPVSLEQVKDMVQRVKETYGQSKDSQVPPPQPEEVSDL